MTGPILKALGSGYASKQIIDFLIRKYPKHKEKIQSAVAMGFTPTQVIKFLTGGRKATAYEEAPNTMTEHEQTMQSESQKKKNINTAVGTGAAIAGTALGGYALSRALPGIAQQLAPGLLGKAATPLQTPPTSPPPTNQPGAIQTPPIQPQPSSPPIQQPNLTANVLPTNVITEIPGLEKKIKDLRNSGNDLVSIAGYFEKFHPQDVKKVEKATGRSFQDLIDAYLTQNPIKQQNEAQPPQQSTPEVVEKNIQQPKVESAPIAPVEPKVLEKQLAALPSGDIGQIESVKNGIAKLNVNGEIRHRKLSELIQEPIEIRNAIHEILQIPESERSAVFDFVNYDPNDKRLYVQFPNGKTVVYLDVDPTHANAIRESKGVPKTTGQTATGEKWIAGIPDSRGAEFFSRIKADPKYSKDNEGKTWYYLEDVYDKYGKLRLKPKKSKKQGS